MERIGDRIRRLMDEYEYSQRELARMVGITPAAMSRYLSNEREPKAEVIANLATALNTTSDYLIRGQAPQDSFSETYRLVARGAATMTDEEKMKLMRLLIGK